MFEYIHDTHIQMIRRNARKSILVIWMAGICCIIFFAIYFLSLYQKAEMEGYNGLPAVKAEAIFNDKTSLVNIGLKMQAIPEANEEKPVVNIRTSKIIYDQKAVKQIKQPASKNFAIKAVPK